MMTSTGPDGPSIPAAPLNPEAGGNPPGLTAAAREQQATLIRRAGITVVIVCGLALIGIALMAFGTERQLDAAGYLALVGTGGGAGLVVAAFADVMKTASGKDYWEVITKAGRLFAAWWALIVSIASATPFL